MEKKDNFFGKSIKIGGVTLPSNIILAPMAGFSDLAFRKLCEDFGAGLTCTEMVSSMALHYKNKKTEDLLKFLPSKTPKAVQIFGHNKEIMAEAVANPLLAPFDLIDINMGCPARKIVSSLDGSALLKDFENAKDIIKACVAVSAKPVTVKFRIGYDKDENIAAEFAKLCENAGVSAITIHGRTTFQGYSGAVDLEAIKSAKKAVKIPVFANGDCRSREDAEKILRITGADGIMIGRASLGRPEIFSEFFPENFSFQSQSNDEKNLKNVHLKTKKFELSAAEKLSQIKWHYLTLTKFFGERVVVKYMRGHLSYYLSDRFKDKKGLTELLRLEEMSEVFAKLDEIFEKLGIN